MDYDSLIVQYSEGFLVDCEIRFNSFLNEGIIKAFGNLGYYYRRYVNDCYIPRSYIQRLSEIYAIYVEGYRKEISINAVQADSTSKRYYPSYQAKGMISNYFYSLALFDEPIPVTSVLNVNYNEDSNNMTVDYSDGNLVMGMLSDHRLIYILYNNSGLITYNIDGIDESQVQEITDNYKGPSYYHFNEIGASLVAEPQP